MATKTWTGAGANNNWSTALNWSGGTIPINGDDIIFNGAFPVTGNKDCTYNGGFVGISFNFTGYTGIFTFSSNLTLSGTLTLDIGTTYATSGTPTTYTLGTSATGMTLVSSGKILPVNFATNGGTTTINGNADFQGNFASTSTSHNIKSATGVPCDLRIGGNVILQAIVTNTTDTVTFKAYGTGKTFNSNGASTNVRVRFVSGSTYTNLGNVGVGGVSFFTVESGGQFNALNNTFNFSTSGTTTLSGFNGLSDFMSINCSGTYILLNDTIIKGFIQITASSCTISTSVGAKILLEGNLIAASSATTIIDYLEFSGTSLSTVSAVSSTNLQIKNISFNKTGAGSVNFTSTGFILTIPSATTYTWTHTAGAITYALTSVVRFGYANFSSTMVYSESGSLTTPSTINSLVLPAGILQLNSPLRATTLSIVGIAMRFTGTAGWTCGTWLCSVSAAVITLQAGVTYITTTNVTMLGAALANRIRIVSSAPTTTYAIWTLQNPASQSMTYVSGQGIDSNAGMTIYSFGGDILTSLPALNWGLGASQGTKAFTFVS